MNRAETRWSLGVWPCLHSGAMVLAVNDRLEAVACTADRSKQEDHYKIHRHVLWFSKNVNDWARMYHLENLDIVILDPSLLSVVRMSKKAALPCQIRAAIMESLYHIKACKVRVGTISIEAAKVMRYGTGQINKTALIDKSPWAKRFDIEDYRWALAMSLAAACCCPSMIALEDPLPAQSSYIETELSRKESPHV